MAPPFLNPKERLVQRLGVHAFTLVILGSRLSAAFFPLPHFFFVSFFISSSRPKSPCFPPFRFLSNSYITSTTSEHWSGEQHLADLLPVPAFLLLSPGSFPLQLRPSGSFPLRLRPSSTHNSGSFSVFPLHLLPAPTALSCLSTDHSMEKFLVEHKTRSDHFQLRKRLDLWRRLINPKQNMREWILTRMMYQAI